MPKTAQSRLRYAKDENGKEILLKNGSMQVMMEWEKPYMQACIEALKPRGDVLEVGFGLGYSSEFIQKHHPKSHTIIESDPVVIEHLKAWAKKFPNVKIIEGTWQDKLQNLNKFDSIFFDDFTPVSSEDLTRVEEERENCQVVSKEINSLKDAIAENLKLFRGVKFSDDELLTFSQQVQSRPDVSKQDVIDFINMLVDLENITPEQRKKVLSMESTLKESIEMQLSISPGDDESMRFVTFTEICLNEHMRPGAILAGAIRSEESLKNNKQFQQRILSKKDVKYTEKTFPVDIPANCQYFQGNEMIIPLIEKRI